MARDLTSYGLLVTPVLVAVAGAAIAGNRATCRPGIIVISWLGFTLGIITIELVRMGALVSTAVTEKSYQIGLIWLVLLYPPWRWLTASDC